VAPFQPRATAIDISRVLIFRMSLPSASKRSCVSSSPTDSLPSRIAIVAGIAPLSRTTVSTRFAVSRFCGRGKPCAITVDSSATTARRSPSAFATSGAMLRNSRIGSGRFLQSKNSAARLAWLP
jgi:hypothetical protein